MTAFPLTVHMEGLTSFRSVTSSRFADSSSSLGVGAILRLDRALFHIYDVFSWTALQITLKEILLIDVMELSRAVFSRDRERERIIATGPRRESLSQFPNA